MLKKYLLFLIIFLTLVGIWIYREQIFAELDKLKNPNQDLKELQLENQGLEQEIAVLKNKLNFNSSSTGLTAQVFSRYPYNDNQSLVVDLGAKNGVKISQPVLLAENYLLGKVINVKADTSEIQTIFSPSWRSSVYIGPQKIEALLVGGRQPILQMIPAEAKINLGDEVVNASPDFPLNLFIGQITEINSQPNATLQQAKLIIDYNPNQLRKVFIITDYEHP